MSGTFRHFSVIEAIKDSLRLLTKCGSKGFIGTATPEILLRTQKEGGLRVTSPLGWGFEVTLI